MKKMMKNYLYIAAAAVAAFAVSACSQDDELRGMGAQGKNAIVASIGTSVSTRTSVADDDATVNWSANDKFGRVYTKASANDLVRSYTLSSGAGTTTGTFTPDEDTNSAFEGYEEGTYAVYPYQENMTISASGAVTMTLNGTDGNVDYTTDSNGPMGGTIEGGAVTFKHLAGLLRITLNKMPADAAKFVLTASNVIAGNFTATLTDDEPELVAATDNTDNNTVTISFDAVADESSKTFYIPVPAGTYSSLNIALQKEGETTALYTREWTDVTIKVADLLRATLDAVTVSGTTPSDVTNELANDVVKENTTVDVEISGAISTTSGAAAIEVPVVSGSNINMNFAALPVTTEAPLEIKAAEGTAADAKSTMTVAMPKVGDTDTAPKVTITLPQSTVTLAPAAATDGAEATTTFGKVIATTADQTLIIEAGVTVKELVIAGGNVKVYGTVEKLSRATENSATVEVASFGAADIKEVETPANFKFTSTWDGVSKIAPAAADALAADDAYNIYTAAQLAGFQSTEAPQAVTKENLPVTIAKDMTLYADVDLDGKPWLGMVMNDATFDGGNHIISNLTINEYLLNQQSTNFTPEGCMGLFSAVYSKTATSTVKNITLDGVSIKPETGKSPKWVGSLVGFSMAKATYENCVAKNVDIYIHGNNSYRVGGLIGYIEGFAKDNTPANVTVKGCKVETATIAASYSYGGLVGSMYDSALFENCSVSDISLALNDGTSGCWRGYVSPFIGDIANSKTTWARTIEIKNCTSRELTEAEQTALEFSKVANEQSVTGKTFTDKCKWCGIVEPAAVKQNNFTLKVTETGGSEKTLQDGVDFNVYTDNASSETPADGE